MVTASKNPWNILHAKHGHASFDRIKIMVKNQSVKGLKYTWDDLKNISPEPCKACYLGKFLKFPAPPTLTKLAEQPYQIVYADIGGPIKQVSKLGNKYWMLMMDGYSTYTWIEFHNNKQGDIIVDDLIKLHKHAINDNKIIKIIRTDSDTIFKSEKLRKYADKYAIGLMYTAPFRHEGHIERQMHTLLQQTRTVMIDADMNDDMWDCAMESVVYTMNRTINSKTNKKSPYELLTGKVPDVSNLVPIGYPAIIKVYDEEIDWYEDYDEDGNMVYNRRKRATLDPRGRLGKVVGYSTDTPNSYLVEVPGKRDLTRKDIIVLQNYDTMKDRIKFNKPLLLENEKTVSVQYPKEILYQHDPTVIEHGTKIIVPIDTSDAAELMNPESDEETESEKDKNKSGVYRGTRFHKKKKNNISPFQRRIKQMAHMIFKEEHEIFKSEQSDTAINNNKVISSRIPYKFADIKRLPLEQKIKWYEGLIKEMEYFTKEKIYRDLLPGEHPEHIFDSRLVFRIKNENSPEEIFKARLVARGFSSIFGIHYDETYSPTILFSSLLMIIHIATINRWTRKMIDVGNAYLNALAKKKIYMRLPLDYTDGKPVIVRMIHSIYGLKDAGLLWYLFLEKALAKFGAYRSRYDPCIFYKDKNGKRIIIAVYVDDLAIFSSDDDTAKEFLKFMENEFPKITKKEDIKKYLNINITEHDQYIEVDMEDKINEMYEKYDVKNHRAKTPLMIMRNEIEEEANEKTENIQSQLGEIGYLAQTLRPDLKFAHSLLSRRSKAAPEVYQKNLQHTIDYIKMTPNRKLKFGKRDKEIKLFGYSDSSHFTPDGRSQGAFVFFLGLDSAAVKTRSFIIRVICLSAMESELRALIETIIEALFLRYLLAEMGYPQKEPTVILVDNSALIDVSTSVESPKKARHAVLWINFLREQVKKGNIILKYIPSRYNIADILTATRSGEVSDFLFLTMMEGHIIAEHPLVDDNNKNG